MKKFKKNVLIRFLPLTICAFLVSLGLTGCITTNWANNNMVNKNMATSIPIWQITKDNSSNSVIWVTHAANPRFEIHDPKNDSNPNDTITLTDDIVLDKETGLVWARDAGLAEKGKWLDAVNYCRNVKLSNRMGWRLPTVEELSSLVDPSQPENVPALPSGHPFVNVHIDYNYWTSTTSEGIWGGNSADAWHVTMKNGFWLNVGLTVKDSEYSHYVWPVRGGNGYATGNW
jgi:hypothetical protein